MYSIELAVAVIVVLIVSIILHEVAHGFMANRLGDPTARLQGRLSLNPLVHIDLLGSILVPALLFLTHAGILFGWAKPVPYNPYNLKDQKWGEAKVALAGPATNLLIAFIFGLILRFSGILNLPASFVGICSYTVYINILLALFNLIPFPPLDGSKIIQPFLPLKAQIAYRTFLQNFERLGLIGSFLLVFIFINLLWTPFSLLVSYIFNIFTGGAGLF